MSKKNVEKKIISIEKCFININFFMMNKKNDLNRIEFLNNKAFIVSFFLVLTIFFVAFFISKSHKNHTDKSIETLLLTPITNELTYKEIKQKGIIRVGVVFNSTSFFIYRGVFMGFEYDLISKFAESEKLKLRLVIKESANELISELDKGNIDIIACGLVNTKPLSKKVLFTNYYTTSRQVLIQKGIKNSIDNHVELIGKTIVLSKGSAAIMRLKNLSEEIGGDILIDTTEYFADETLIEMVANDSIKYTVCDERVAKINKKYYSKLNISIPISFPQKLSWAVKINSDGIKNAVDTWIDKEKKKGTINRLYIKYFTDRDLYSQRLNSEYMIYKLNEELKISQYDSLLKVYSKDINWDWRLLSSMMYEESKFRRTARSWVGATGLFQVMPETSREFGGKNMFDPKDNIRTAVKYIADLQRQWKFIEDQNERIKFIIASYNAGAGHVHDARRLAKLNGYNGEVWDNSVGIFIEKLMESQYYTNRVVRYGYCRGNETHKYVDRIIKRFNKYKSMTKQKIEKK